MKNYANQFKFPISPDSLNKARQKVFSLQKETYHLFSTILNNNRLLKGVVYLMERTCGKASCKCATSSYRHASWYLTRSENGKTKVSYIKHKDVDAFQRLSEEYKEFRVCRQKIADIYVQIIKTINQIEKIKTRALKGRSNVKAKDTG